METKYTKKKLQKSYAWLKKILIFFFLSNLKHN